MEILIISYWDFQDYGMQVTKKTPLYFATNGHHVTFLVHSEQTANPSNIMDLHPNIRVYRFNLPFKFLSIIPKIGRIRQLLLFGMYCLFYSLRTYKKGRKPDVIYAAECDAILIGCILRRIYKVPLIGRYYGIPSVQLKNPWSHFLYLLAITRKVDMAIVTNDGTQGREVLKKLNPKIKNVKFWRNGIEQMNVDKGKISKIVEDFNIEPGDFVLLTVSRLDYWKRVDRAIRIFSHLAKSTKGNIKLVIVGDGPERRRLEIMADKLGVSRATIFAGGIRHEDIYNFYELADVFLSFYDMSNVGNPLLEALNSGKCIVTLNIGETSNVIRNGENGKILKVEKDEEELAKKGAEEIKGLIEDDDYRHRLEEGARAYAKEFLWTWDERLRVEMASIEELVKYCHTS